MLEKTEIKITEAEAQLYDRQIRLWGLDAQKRLRSSRILVSGIRGLGCEVAKNLVLAGVRSLTLMDHEDLTKEDGGANFLAPRDKVGFNRAEASLDRLRLLNPMVEIISDSSNIAEKSEKFFGEFDIVFMTGQSRDDLIKVNAMCRKVGAKFYAGDVCGFFGFSFVDLGEHEYVEEVKVDAEESTDLDCEPKPKKAKVDNDGKKEEAATKMVKSTMKFLTLDECLAVDWNEDVYAKRIRRMDPSYFVLQILFEFYSREGRPPSESNREGDLDTLRRLSTDVTEKFGLPETKIPESILPLVVFPELSPVAAIVGGVVAQEIIKAISNRDAPNKNFFLYNPLESAGIVENIE